MSEFDDFAPSQENNSNSMDNDFEKVDALSTPEAEAAETDFVSSTQSDDPQVPEPSAPEPEEEISSSPVVTEDTPLVDLGFASSDVRQEPDSSMQEPSPPVPQLQSTSPQIQLPTKKYSPPGMSLVILHSVFS